VGRLRGVLIGAVGQNRPGVVEAPVAGAVGGDAADVDTVLEDVDGAAAFAGRAGDHQCAVAGVAVGPARAGIGRDRGDGRGRRHGVDGDVDRGAGGEIAGKVVGENAHVVHAVAQRAGRHRPVAGCVGNRV